VSERCVGCSAEFDAIEGPIHRYMTSSPACWSRYGELLGALAIQPDSMESRLYCVDAYAVQHPGTPNPQAIQSVAVHLLNMYGYLMRGLPVTPPRLAGHKGAFRWLNPPAKAAALTVRDMPIAADAAATAVASRAWVEAAWAAWAEHHEQIAAWHASYAIS
jgi:hypothetical protein